MHLSEFLSQKLLTAAEIRQRMNELGANVKDDAQIRQWGPKDGKPSRRPDAANCRYLELATGGRVTRADMRPDDYAAIWPELAPSHSRKPARRSASKSPEAKVA